MSKLLEKPVTKLKREVKAGARNASRQVSAHPRPIAKPHIHANARIIRKKSPNIAGLIFGKCALFLCVMAFVYGASSFTGQLLLEGARQQKLDAKRRSHDAKIEERKLTERLDKLTSAEGIHLWAMSNNLVAPDAQNAPDLKKQVMPSPSKKAGPGMLAGPGERGEVEIDVRPASGGLLARR